MYKDKWGLSDKPFQNVPDTRYLFYSSSHEEALVRLLYSVTESKGLMLLLGSHGAGKTFTCRVFQEKVREKGYEVAILHPPPLTLDDLLAQVADAFLQNGKVHSRFRIYQELEEKARVLAREGRELVLILDEAQYIRDDSVLEEVRLLLNLTLAGRFLVNVVLAGVPELWTSVRRIEGLAQRVGLTFRIDGITRAETEEYIMHRLKIAGLNHNIFLSDALDQIYSVTHGIPGRINSLCDLCMLIATAEGKDDVDTATVQKAASELSGRDVMEEEKPA